MRVIELFAGAGGAALGLERAGFSHAALVERDADACATLRAAGLGPVVEGDVRDLDAVAAVAGESCDLLWSSYPCQAFSQAGRRLGADDDRNGWPWTVDAIDRFSPTWFLGENVRGLLSFDYFDEVIMGQLRQRFRCAGFWLLNAADVGVPQYRRRVFTWAGPSPLVPPTRTHGPGMFTEPWVSMGEVLQIDDSSKWLNRPAPSVTTADGQGVGSADSRDILERAIGRRRLTVDECATLQGFPADHPWQGTKTSRYRQVGNAVPPALAEAVGRTVINAGRGQPC
jgi:DNA (cytosine-5)-methyltransferase 1